MSALFEFNGAEDAGYSQPPPIPIEVKIPTALQRKNLPRWPRASEPELVRHYTWLSSRNFGIISNYSILHVGMKMEKLIFALVTHQICQELRI